MKTQLSVSSCVYLTRGAPLQCKELGNIFMTDDLADLIGIPTNLLSSNVLHLFKNLLSGSTLAHSGHQMDRHTSSHESGVFAKTPMPSRECISVLPREFVVDHCEEGLHESSIEIVRFFSLVLFFFLH